MLNTLFIVLMLTLAQPGTTVPANQGTHPEAAAGAPADTPLSEYREMRLGAWTVLVHPRAESLDATRYHRVLAALRFDLELIDRAVPREALEALHTVRIVVTPAMRARAGMSGRGMCYHESAGWLTSAGLDAQREGVVEICNMDDYLAWRAEQPMMVLHELSHAYHAMLGAERPEVLQAYAAAKASGTYEHVTYALAPAGQTRPAYAMTNAKEYFAEVSEAWFGRNDYGPCTREELKAMDPHGAAMVEKMWGLSAAEIRRGSGAAGHRGS